MYAYAYTYIYIYIHVLYACPKKYIQQTIDKYFMRCSAGGAMSAFSFNLTLHDGAPLTTRITDLSNHTHPLFVCDSVWGEYTGMTITHIRDDCWNISSMLASASLIWRLDATVRQNANMLTGVHCGLKSDVLAI